MKFIDHAPSLRKSVIKAMMFKEFRQLLRDPRMRMIVFVAPVLMLLVFGYAASTDVQNIRVAVYDQDKTFESRRIIEKIFSSGHFILSHNASSLRDIEQYIQRSECEAAVNIPPGFALNASKGRKVLIQLILDGTDPNRSMIIGLHLQTAIMPVISEQSQNSALQKAFTTGGTVNPHQPVVAVERIFFNETLESRVYFLPAILGLIMALVIIMLTSMSIVKERENGNMDQITVSPIRPTEYIIGKTIPYGLIALINIITISIIIVAWFGIPLRGSFLLLLFCALLYIIACLGLGIFISTISSSQQQAMLTTFLILLPALMLSGFVFPIASMPQSIQFITYANPMRYFMTLVREIFLKGTGITALWDQMLPLAVLGFIFITLSIGRFKRGFL
jgi:ABC-2 type transport system permease protein